jgi:AcrR family transcriptional regulator
MTVFWGKGYEGASLEKLQSAMGAISLPSFYAAFRSKELLFFEAVDLYLETVGHRPRQALESAVTAREGVEAMLREVVESAAARVWSLVALLLSTALDDQWLIRAIVSGSKNCRVTLPILMYQHSRSSAFGVDDRGEPVLHVLVDHRGLKRSAERVNCNSRVRNRPITVSIEDRQRLPKFPLAVVLV